MEPSEEREPIAPAKSLPIIERGLASWCVFRETRGMGGRTRRATTLSLARWAARGDWHGLSLPKQYLPARVQLDLARKSVRRRVWGRRLLILAGLSAMTWIIANPVVGFCRRHWPNGTSEVLHGLWALVTSPGFGAVGAVIAALVAFRAALHSQARSASNDRWWETFEWVMTNRVERDDFDAQGAAEWFSYLKGTASSPGESVIINVLTQEAIRRGQTRG